MCFCVRVGVHMHVCMYKCICVFVCACVMTYMTRCSCRRKKRDYWVIPYFFAIDESGNKIYPVHLAVCKCHNFCRLQVVSISKLFKRLADYLVAEWIVLAFFVPVNHICTTPAAIGSFVSDLSAENGKSMCQLESCISHPFFNPFRASSFEEGKKKDGTEKSKHSDAFYVSATASGAVLCAII